MATLVWLPKNYSGVTNLKSKGQKELDEYIFTRKDVAKLLGISPNAVRHRMRRGATTLEYRFDGSKFLFKRPGDNELRGHPLATPKSHEKALRDHDRSVQKRLFPKRYNRGSTHEEHGGKPSKGGTYTQPSFKYHNEMKMLNSLQNKYQNPAQRREFEAMNEEALKEADKRAKKKAEEMVPTYHARPKYGGPIGLARNYWDTPYDIDDMFKEPPPSTSYNITGAGRFVGYGNINPPEEKQETIITWEEPVIKDPGADYKPGKFKHLDEAIRNTKKKSW